MVKVIETQMNGISHFIINKEIINIFSENNDVHFYGEKSQISLLEAEKIVLKKKTSIKVQQYAKKWQLPFYVIYHFCIILYILFTSNRKDKIVFTSLFPLTHFLLKPMLILSNTKKYIVLHGELKQIETYNNIFLKTLGVFLRLSLKLKISNLQYIILGQPIKDAIIEKKWLTENEMICIEHPYDFHNTIEKELKREHLNIISIGSASVNKGVHHFFNLAKKNTRFDRKFQLVGAILDEKLHFYLHDKVEYTHEKFLSFEVYNKMLSSADIAVFYLDKNEYTYTASAAFLDAIKYSIPIFALRNSFFQYYFDKYGELGVLYDDINELESVILSEKLNQVINSKKNIWHRNFDSVKNNKNTTIYF